MPRRDSSGTPATVALTAAGVPFTAHTYDHDPRARSFGLEAAEALGLPAERVFKTLLVDTGAGLAVGIVPVSTSLDLKALAAALAVKNPCEGRGHRPLREDSRVVSRQYGPGRS
jgi:Cys-tRNA(Pro)/Cys-tRNA(Cys) deacylase